jgi:ribosomal protein L19E
MAQIFKKNNWFNEKLRKMRDTLQLLNTLRNNKTVDNTTYLPKFQKFV